MLEVIEVSFVAGTIKTNRSGNDDGDDDCIEQMRRLVVSFYYCLYFYKIMSFHMHEFSFSSHFYVCGRIYNLRSTIN